MLKLRAASLTNFDQVARFVGLDPTAMLREAGIDPALMADREQPLPSARVAALLESCARRSGCAHFGLLMAETRTLGSGGPLVVLLKFLPRVCDIIDKVAEYQHLVGSALQLSTEHVDSIQIVHAELNGTYEQRQAIELMIAFYCRAIALILGRPWRAESIHFMHGAPADLTAHRRILPGPIQFQSTFNGFVCSRQGLAERNPTEDAELAAHVERMLRAIMPAHAEASASERVRRALRLLLPAGRATIEPVAENLGVSPRSLQRMLEREGTRFGAILNAQRRELALRYMSDPSLRVGAVAGMTGFQRASSFTRWFCEEFGKPPGMWRAEAREAA